MDRGAWKATQFMEGRESKTTEATEHGTSFLENFFTSRSTDI